MLKLFLDRTPTPIGLMTLVADEAGRLCLVGWDGHEARLERSLRVQYGSTDVRLEPTANPAGLTAALDAYFRGELTAIDSLAVAINGTPFQRTVWAALREIPCGTTISYGELARRIGKPAAVRAVGLANGSNPIGVVVPCHRVIGANGSLTGYGGGLDRKRWLLAHERASGPPSLLDL